MSSPEQVFLRRADERSGPVPTSSPERYAESPRTRTAGSPEPFDRTRSAAAAASSATAIIVAASARPSRSGAARRSTSGTSPAHPIATST